MACMAECGLVTARRVRAIYKTRNQLYVSCEGTNVLEKAEQGARRVRYSS
jgi:hypothetical protein